MGIDLVNLFISFALLAVAITVHEFSHGYVAFLRGDTTAQRSGRLSFNPLAHIDPVGTVLLPLVLYISTGGRFVFGAAKAVPINYAALRNPRRDIIWIGLAGPVSNFLFAFLASVLWKFLPAHQVLDTIMVGLIRLNVILGVFNLIPIPPLDGSRVVMGLLPVAASRAYASIEPYGFLIVLALLWTNMLDWLIFPAVGLMQNLIMSIHF